MATQPTTGRAAAPHMALGPFLRILLGLLFSIALGVLLVALLIFAPEAFLARDLPFAQRWSNYARTVGDYLLQLLRGDFGTLRGRPVSRELWNAAIRSLQLLGVSLLVALPLGVGWGALLATTRRGRLGTLFFGISTLVISLPSFVVLLLAIEGVATLTLRTGFRITYVQGYGFDRHLMLPVAVLALRGAAFMARAVQVAQEEIERQDWVRVARAKGLGGFALWRRHVLPALRVPLLGSTLGMLRVMVGGLIIVDYVYGWGGLGRKLLQIGNGGQITASVDPVGAGAAVLFVVFFAATDLLGRLLVRRLDPRVREEVQER